MVHSPSSKYIRGPEMIWTPMLGTQILSKWERIPKEEGSLINFPLQADLAKYVLPELLETEFLRNEMHQQKHCVSSLPIISTMEDS